MPRLVTNRRQVLLSIPDIDDNEAFIRHCADMLLQAKRVVVLEVSREIPDMLMPAAVQECEMVLARHAHAARRLITQAVTAKEDPAWPA